MRRHYLATGAHLTTWWQSQGAQIMLAGTIPGATPADERRLKAAGHFKDWCPVCLGLVSGEPLTTTCRSRSRNVPGFTQHLVERRLSASFGWQ